ncbi:hypothetical protein ACLQ22_09840 [Micromonospora sp. DT178]|uniref:hypothetical protein n=1 Tax=Micromonospora sp. DT178 TaxID=3393436 RepID=UPI003CE6F46B
MLDAILAEAAAAAGAEVPDGTAVTGLTIDGKRVTGVRYTTAEGEATERADLMVGRWIALNTDETGGRALYAERPRLACTYYPYWVDVPIDFEIYERPGSWWPRFARTTISTLADEYMPQARFAHVRRDAKAASLAGIAATAAALWQRFRVSPGRHTPRIRGHWSTEIKVHRVHDVTYDDEPSQIRTGTGPQVTAALRNAAISAPRTAGITNNAATNRHHARGNHPPTGTTRHHLTTLPGP